MFEVMSDCSWISFLRNVPRFLSVAMTTHGFNCGERESLRTNEERCVVIPESCISLRVRGLSEQIINTLTHLDQKDLDSSH